MQKHKCGATEQGLHPPPTQGDCLLPQALCPTSEGKSSQSLLSGGFTLHSHPFSGICVTKPSLGEIPFTILF